MQMILLLCHDAQVHVIILSVMMLDWYMKYFICDTYMRLWTNYHWFR